MSADCRRWRGNAPRRAGPPGVPGVVAGPVVDLADAHDEALLAQGLAEAPLRVLGRLGVLQADLTGHHPDGGVLQADRLVAAVGQVPYQAVDPGDDAADFLLVRARLFLVPARVTGLVEQAFELVGVLAEGHGLGPLAGAHLGAEAGGDRPAGEVGVRRLAADLLEDVVGIHFAAIRR